MSPDTLQKKLQHLPTRPGVYLLKDERGEILYVGKANSLRARLKSHFAQDYTLSLKAREMIRRVADFDTIVVGSEAEHRLQSCACVEIIHPGYGGGPGLSPARHPG